MDSNLFDRLTKLFAAQKLSRRTAIGSAAGAGIIAKATTRNGALAQDSAPKSSPVAVDGDAAENVMFVQGYRSGRLEPQSGSENEFILTLQDGLGQTVYFTDRPERMFGAVATEDFLNGFDFREENPPNAALVSHNDAGDEEVVVVELMSPAYDEMARTVTYDAKILGDFDEFDASLQSAPVDAKEVSEEFTDANLFIDSCSDLTIECCTVTHDGPASECLQQFGSFGPMGFCWSFPGVCCHPCADADQDHWTEQCNINFSGCNGDCVALYSGCW